MVNTSVGRSPRTSDPMKSGGQRSALKLLNVMAFEAMQRRYPDIRPGLLPPPKYNDSTANGLTKCILHYIRLTGGQAERINTTGRPIDNTRIVDDCLGFRRQIGSVKWLPTSGSKGSADISATIQGKSVKVEVKIHDKQSEQQKIYQRDIEASGGLYFIATSFEQFYQWYQETFKK